MGCSRRSKRSSSLRNPLLISPRKTVDALVHALVQIGSQIVHALVIGNRGHVNGDHNLIYECRHVGGSDLVPSHRVPFRGCPKRCSKFLNRRKAYSSISGLNLP